VSGHEFHFLLKDCIMRLAGKNPISHIMRT
jgi:hypothetical protein